MLLPLLPKFQRRVETVVHNQGPLETADQKEQ